MVCIWSVELVVWLGELWVMIVVYWLDLWCGVLLFVEFDEYDLVGLWYEMLYVLEWELGVL